MRLYRWSKQDNMYVADPAEVIKLYRYGADHKGVDDYELCAAVEDMGYAMAEGSDAMEIIRCGQRYGNRINPVNRSWARYGNVRIDRDGMPHNSNNYADDRPECGVSVADKDWINTVSSMFFAGSIYRLSGVQIGWGSDGEPLIKVTAAPIKTKYRSIKSAVNAIA